MLTELCRRARSARGTATRTSPAIWRDDDILATIAQTIDAERQCCRFLRFSITVEPDGGPITLELTGPPGTREFLSAFLDRMIRNLGVFVIAAFLRNRGLLCFLDVDPAGCAAFTSPMLGIVSLVAIRVGFDPC